MHMPQAARHPTTQVPRLTLGMTATCGAGGVAALFATFPVAAPPSSPAPLHRRLSATSSVRHRRRVSRAHDLHAFLPAPSRAAAARFLERHQKAERRILELQVPQHVPVLAHVRLQERQHVPEADDAAGRNGGAGRKRAERDQPHGERRRDLRRAACRADAARSSSASPTSPKRLTTVFSTSGSRMPVLMPTRPSLTSPMIMSIESPGTPRPGSRPETSRPAGTFPSGPRHRLPGRKAKRQDVDVGQRAKPVARRAGDDRIFGRGEVTVELQVRLNEGDGVIHVVHMRIADSVLPTSASPSSPGSSRCSSATRTPRSVGSGGET